MRKFFFLVLLIGIIVCLVGVSIAATARDLVLTSDEHIVISEQMIDELWNSENLATLSEFYQLPFTDHAFTIDESVPWTPVAWGNTVLRMYHRAFPDLEISVEKIIATDDMVIVHYKAQGTHEGGFANVNGVRIAPSGKASTWDGVWIFRFENGKIAEQWAYSNNPLVQQSGYGNTTD